MIIFDVIVLRVIFTLCALFLFPYVARDSPPSIFLQFVALCGGTQVQGKSSDFGGKRLDRGVGPGFECQGSGGHQSVTDRVDGSTRSSSLA
jgi:hypothetical protein